jgi:hypothetical protein
MLDILYLRQLLGPPLPSAATGDPSSSNFNITPEAQASLNNQAFNPNINLSSVTGNIPGGVPFDSAGASQASNFTLI